MARLSCHSLGERGRGAESPLEYHCSPRLAAVAPPSPRSFPSVLPQSPSCLLGTSGGSPCPLPCSPSSVARATFPSSLWQLLEQAMGPACCQLSSRSHARESLLAPGAWIWAVTRCQEAETLSSCPLCLLGRAPGREIQPPSAPAAASPPCPLMASRDCRHPRMGEPPGDRVGARGLWGLCLQLRLVPQDVRLPLYNPLRFSTWGDTGRPEQDVWRCLNWSQNPSSQSSSHGRWAPPEY